VVQATNRGDTTPAVRPLDAQIISPPVPPSEMTDAELGAQAAAAVERHLAMRESAIESAVRAGELLREARARCDSNKRSWRDWLTRYWPKSRQTAQRYMALALEVQQISGPRAGRNLLGLPSIRAALTEADYDAGGARDPSEQDEDERGEEEQATIDRLAQDREDERQERKATREPGPPAPRGGLAASSSASVDPSKIAEQAEAARRRAELRAQIEDASNRNPLVPPENPHQVGRPKPPEPAPDPEATCNAADLREIADLLDALSRDAWSALSRLNAVRFAPVHDDDGRRDAEITQAREAVAALAESAGNVAKKRGHQLRELANVEARVIGLERERRHKEAKKARRGA
jgi:hypothetical protein